MGYRPYTIVWVGLPVEALSAVGVDNIEEARKMFVRKAENLDEIDTDSDWWISHNFPVIVEKNGEYVIEASDNYGDWGMLEMIMLDSRSGGDIGIGIEICGNLAKEDNPAEIYSSPKIKEATEMMNAAIDKVFPADKAEKLKEAVKVETSNVII